MGKFFATLWASLSSAARAVISFLLPILKTHAGDLIAAALPIAQGIVTSLANQQIPDVQKRDQAVSQLKNALVAQGYATAADVATSTLNLVIEMAVAKLKTQVP
jgi:hypothetical protein